MAFSKAKENLWPSIVDIPSAKKASRQGVWAPTWCTGSTIFLVIVNVLGYKVLDFDIWALGDAFLFIIGWGIFKMNRVAAGSGLFLYVLERIVM